MKAVQRNNNDFDSVVATYGSTTYLLTTNKSGPHTCQVIVKREGGHLTCWPSVSATLNIRTNSNVTLLWPPFEEGGYSIIVNGIATVSSVESGNIASIDVTKSVLHRPGQRATGTQGPCPSDCITLLMEAAHE